MNTLCGLGIHFTVDGFRILYGLIAAFMWIVSGLFSIEYFGHYKNKGRYYFFLILTFLATEGVFFSADFYTTFIFFEIMSFTSYVWVVQDEKKESMRAGATYLAVAVIGGLVMLMGIFLLYTTLGTLTFSELKQAYVLHENVGINGQLWAAGLCMLFGFGAKAGAFPLHIWLPKAHPVAPAPASALLSGMLTKTGVFGILILSTYLFVGVDDWAVMILYIGVITMALGAILALFSTDLKRTLACSSVSQIGFILTGVGTAGLLGVGENALAIRGSLLHMVNHSLIKLVLFIAAGVVFMNLHQLDLNRIRGFGRKKPLLTFIFLMGALGIGGVPLFNGYVSKTLIHEGIVEYTHLIAEEGAGLIGVDTMKAIEWIFLISGGLTVAYMTKLFVAVFVEKNEDPTLQEQYDAMAGRYMNPLSTFVLTCSAVVLPVLGVFPTLTMDRIADFGQGFMGGVSPEHAVHYFSLENLKGALISLVVGALVYLIIVRKWMMKKNAYVDRWPKALDLENLLYRPVLLSILPMIFGVLCRILDSAVDTVVVLLRKTVLTDRKIPHELEEGTMFTLILSVIARPLYVLRQKIRGKKVNTNLDFAHIFAMRYEKFRENEVLIARSMSFGLLLFCVGLFLTAVYLLFM